MSTRSMFGQTPPANMHQEGSDRIANDYIRTDFTVEDGLPDDVVNAIVQTENGLLWIGTQAGLASFDGREFSPTSLQTPGSPSQGGVHALLESSNGDLWVGTDAGVVLIPRPATDQFDPTRLTFFRLGSAPSNKVESIFQAHDGTIWAGTNHGLYREVSGTFTAVIPNLWTGRISEALNGNLLLVTGEGFIEWDGLQIIRHPGVAASFGVHDDEIFDVFQSHDGTMWYGTSKGILRKGHIPLPSLQPVAAAESSAFRTSEDQKGNLWVRTKNGVFLVSGDTMENLSPSRSRSFYAARDGEFWIGTNGNGLIHLKRRSVKMFTSSDGLPNDVAMAVLSSHDGKLWVGSNCGLSVLEDSRFKVYTKNDGLLNTCVWTLAEDRNWNLWIGTFGGGLFRFRDGRFTQFSLAQGLPSDVVVQVIVARDNTLWIATPNGISHMQNGHFQNYTVADGLSSNQALAVYQDRSGIIWTATQGGIDRLVGERFVAFPSAQSRAGPFSTRFMQDSLGDLYTANSPQGISLIQNGRLTQVNEDLKVLDMAESPQHDLWFSGSNGVVRIRISDLKSSAIDHETPLNYELIDRADGLGSIQCSVGWPNLAITPDNKLWIATVKGLAMLDLARPPAGSPKPKVFVGTVTIGKDRKLAGGEAILPPGTHHLELHMEAVDLASPEKIHLQYRLDGVDAAWLDADATRTAVYTNIPVGPHAFHVRASSSDGVWDRTGIVYDIVQSPYFYQTTWFRVISVCAVLLLLSAAYFFRVKQIVHQTQMRLDAQVSERERIARDLHDTFFQGIEGFLLHLHVITSRLRLESGTAERISSAFSEADAVMAQGRSLIFELRTQIAAGDLVKAIEAFIDQVQRKPEFRVELRVLGAPRKLAAYPCEETLKIVREAIWNAIRHANGNYIEVALHYSRTALNVCVEDDGVGIDPDILANGGRPGHWGLPGIRERAQTLGAQLEIDKSALGGARICLRVPSKKAYESRLRTLAARLVNTSEPAK